MKPITAEWVAKAEADKKSAVEAKRLCSFFRKIARSALRLRT